MPAEITTDQLEQVARAADAMRKLQAENRTWTMEDLARAAIAAMQGKPVAYLHQHPDFNKELDWLWLTPGDKANGWTETPLYALPPAPEQDTPA